jgi:hypothetical protein
VQLRIPPRRSGVEYKIDWAAIAVVVPSRSTQQCRDRWRHVFALSFDQSNTHIRTGRWTAVEDSKLRDALQTLSSKNWVAIAALVPGRRREQCRHRWRDVLDPNIDRATGRKGTRTAVEDSKLQDAVQTHGGKKWGAIAALFPSPTKLQYWGRWNDTLIPNINQANERTGTWVADEDRKLKDAVDTLGSMNWVAIAALVPGRKRQ